MLGKEPTLIIQSVVLALNVVQTAAIPMTTLAHTLIGAGVIGLGAMVNRSQVTPAGPGPAKA